LGSVAASFSNSTARSKYSKSIFLGLLCRPFTAYFGTFHAGGPQNLQSRAYGRNGSLQFSGDRRSVNFRFQQRQKLRVVRGHPWSAVWSRALLHFPFAPSALTVDPLSNSAFTA
jgi:hypothetical protein